MLLERQLSFFLARGQKDGLADATITQWRARDVEPRGKLVIGDGDYRGGYLSIASGGSQVLQLPEGYSSANQLTLWLAADGFLEATLVDPVHGTSTFLLKGTNGTTNGDHPAVLAFSSRVTSLTLSNPASYAATVNVEFFAFELPTLTAAASWSDGYQTLGVV